MRRECKLLKQYIVFRVHAPHAVYGPFVWNQYYLTFMFLFIYDVISCDDPAVPTH